MNLETVSAPPSRVAAWSGRIISALIVAMMLMGAGMNLSHNEMAVKGAVDMGYPANTVFGIGLALLVSAVLYAIPQTSVLGAILLTGYLGGAVATHVRAGQSSAESAPAIVFGVLVWLALLLRNPRLRGVLPLTKG